MFTKAFDKVDWLNVHRMLKDEMPRLFQVWGSKQVMNISAITNRNLNWHHQDGCSNKCPCCTTHVETATHVILCPEASRVEAFMQSAQALEKWPKEANTDPDLMNCIMD
jgi:hypothetical protein